MFYILDTYAWVEYLIGSQKGEKVKKLFSDKDNSFLTVECCLAELRGWSLRNDVDFDYIIELTECNSKIVEVDREDWINAARIKWDMMKRVKKFGLMDSLLLAKQKNTDAIIVTGDKDFRKLKNILFLS